MGEAGKWGRPVNRLSSNIDGKWVRNPVIICMNDNDDDCYLIYPIQQNLHSFD